jgi:hypothetical protein
MNYDALGAKALTSNVVEPYFAVIDMQSKKQVDNIKIPCAGSHGITSSDINGHYYVQCIGAVNATFFEFDPTTKAIVKRFTSAYLNNKNGVSNSGVGGQPYSSPENKYFIVPNPSANVIAVFKPTPTGTDMLEIAVNFRPGKTKFYPKDTSVTFGTDPNPSNYWAVINLEDKSANGGLAFIDMAVVVDAFKRNATLLDASIVTYLSTGPGKGDRPIARGNDFALSPVLTGTSSTDTTFGSVTLVNVKTKTVLSTFAIPAISRVLWVPVHNDEVGSNSNINNINDNNNNNNNCDNTRANQAIIIGSVGLFVGFVALVALIISLIWTSNPENNKKLNPIQTKDEVTTSV